MTPNITTITAINMAVVGAELAEVVVTNECVEHVWLISV